MRIDQSGIYCNDETGEFCVDWMDIKKIVLVHTRDSILSMEVTTNIGKRKVIDLSLCSLYPYRVHRLARMYSCGKCQVVDITRFIEGTLYLKVNKEKTVVSYVRGVKYLGYSFYVMKGKCQLTVHPKSKAKMKSRLKELTNRSNGWGYAKRKQKLKEYIRGWVGYYHLADMKRLLLETDEWLRRRIRMCIWKAWKKPKTKVANLIKCGINKYKAYEWGNTRKGYWRIADSSIRNRGHKNEIYVGRVCYFNGFVSRMAPKIGTAVCGTARTVV